MKTRYKAEWLTGWGDQPDEGDFDPDLCTYDESFHDDFDTAANVAAKNDLIGEGTVEVQVYRPYRHQGVDIGQWDTVERHKAYLLDDGGVTTEKAYGHEDEG